MMEKTEPDRLLVTCMAFLPDRPGRPAETVLQKGWVKDTPRARLSMFEAVQAFRAAGADEVFLEIVRNRQAEDEPDH